MAWFTIAFSLLNYCACVPSCCFILDLQTLINRCSVELIKGERKAGGKPTIIRLTFKEKCMAEGKKELIGLLRSEASTIYSLDFI